MANALPIACILVACVGVSLLISSVATNNWAKYTILYKFHEGLFTKCINFKGSEVCNKLYKDIGDVPAKFAGVIALMILAIIFEVLSLIVKIAGVLMEKKLDIAVGVMQLIAVIFGAAGLSLYAKNYLDDTRDADWSYIIGWLGVSLLGISLVLLLLVFMRR